MNAEGTGHFQKGVGYPPDVQTYPDDLKGNVGYLLTVGAYL